MVHLPLINRAVDLDSQVAGSLLDTRELPLGQSEQ